MNCIARAVFWIIALILSGATYAESSFDGITIISFEGKMGNDAIADGDHIIVFVSGKGSYVSVATEFRGIRRGCISAAESGSYTGNSIRFGVPGELRQRKYKQDTLCPQFSLQFEDEQTVRVRAGIGTAVRTQSSPASPCLQWISARSTSCATRSGECV